MRNCLSFAGMLACVLFSLSAFGQNINIPDASFKNALVYDLCVDTDGDNAADADADTNDDGEISVGEAEAVTWLDLTSRNIDSLLGISYFSNLQYLYCPGNYLPSLDVQGLTNLQHLDCHNNYPLTSLNIQGLTNLQYLDCWGCRFTSLDVQGLTSLQDLNCLDNDLISLNVQGCINLRSLDCRYNQLPSLDVQGLTNLQNLNCLSNLFTSLNVQNLINLKDLNCGGTQFENHQLNNLNVSGCINLQNLTCMYDSITSLNVQGLTNLQNLNCAISQLTSLNVQGLTNLQNLNCGGNQLTSLDAQNLTNLQYLNCANNQLTSLNVEGLTNLQSLQCSSNQLTSLDVSSCTSLLYFECYNNQLITLFMKNGMFEGSDEQPQFPQIFNPTLQYVCCDEFQIDFIRSVVDGGFGKGANCTINSYCSFVPGGKFYPLEGKTTLDLNNNGCETTDPVYPNLQFNITDGTNSGTFISNTTGSYLFPLSMGSHTITPQLENPNYFTVSPSSVTLNLPQDTLNLEQNFCIAPNGDHHDVEVTIIPIIPARPGFNATYQIVYKNKGSVIESDSLTFTFQDDRIDFVSASIAPDAQRTNVLRWDYTNLQPFETRIITVTLNINSPMESPAVNVGNILSFQAAIYPFVPDEALYDNTHNFRQVVVGSFDPNDKICLEGNEILPEMVGEYLHYLIRFENTGTYAAENIVVKDMIDATKFDISTLQLTKASHECWVRVIGENRVEFIFENINLPFTEPDKHGYVAFKVKTKPNLVLGDTVTNQADIFFDYNFPITTNVASTQIVEFLSVKNTTKNDFAVTLQPNPTTGFVQFSQTTATLQKAEVYDNLGRLVQTSGIQNNQMNIASLASGIYFIKVIAKEGVSVQKVVKE